MSCQVSCEGKEKASPSPSSCLPAMQAGTLRPLFDLDIGEEVLESHATFNNLGRGRQAVFLQDFKARKQSFRNPLHDRPTPGRVGSAPTVLCSWGSDQKWREIYIAVARALRLSATPCELHQVVTRLALRDAELHERGLASDRKAACLHSSYIHKFSRAIRVRARSRQVTCLPLGRTEGHEAM